MENGPARPAGSDPTGPAGTMRKADVAWLGSAVLLLVFVALDPLLGFPVFGSDTGEYYNLTSALMTYGHLPGTAYYAGWGFGYPGFPGLFELSGAVAGGTGSGVLLALQTVAPVLGALAVVPLFLLFRRLVPNDSVAILGATLGAVFMPRIFSVAHPAPLSLGDFLVVGALWMFFESRRDARWYVPLTLTAGALIATHHLSSYFFVVSAVGLVVVTELAAPRRWSVRFPTRELAFLAGFLTVAFADWFYYAKAFSAIVSAKVFGVSLSFPIVEGAMLAAFVLVGLAVRFRRRSGIPRPHPARFPGDRSVLRDALILLVGIYAGVGLVVFHPLPGTTGQVAAPGALVFFAPIFAAIVLAAGSRRLLSFAPNGAMALTWLFAVGLSAIFALAAGLTTISPERHAEYLVLPLGLLTAVATGRLVGLVHDRGGRPAAIAAGLAVVVLVGANAAIAYPPPSDFGGFQEGLTNGDAAVWMWTGIAVPAGDAVASDHRVSSMVFGFDGDPATWQSTTDLFTGTNVSEALAELRSTGAPRADLPISLVIVDGTMRSTGVALDPAGIAAPLSPQAAAWLEQPPFVVVYENGGTTGYWVDFGAGPT